MPLQDAYERILQSTGLRTQTDVAALLGVKQSSISDAKRRNHIPDSWILTLFNKKGLNPSWIRTGEGPQYVAPVRQRSIKSSLPPPTPTTTCACSPSRKGANHPDGTGTPTTCWM